MAIETQEPPTDNVTSITETPVIDFMSKRSEKIEEKRRKTERIFFKQILGVYSVVGSQNFSPVEIVDVSEDGCALQVEHGARSPWPENATEVPIRIYFSQDTYLPLQLKIMNSRPAIEGGVRYMRYGCVVDKSLSSYDAFLNFVLFLKSYALHAHSDTGGITAFYL